MIGIVLVSHSAPLAAATAELALQMAGDDPPPVRVAAGADGGLGTDAVAIAAAIDALAAEVDGVLVIPDLGSAVLSAELALDLRESAVPVVVSDGPFVEAATVAVVAAAGGGSLDAVARDAADALRVKRGTEVSSPAGGTIAEEPTGGGGGDPAASAEGTVAAGPPERADRDPTASVELVLPNPLGLHARPAAVLARAAAGFDADIRLTDVTAARGPADAASVVALLALGATGGHTLRVEATGPDADPALDALTALIAAGFGETE